MSAEKGRKRVTVEQRVGAIIQKLEETLQGGLHDREATVAASKATVAELEAAENELLERVTQLRERVTQLSGDLGETQARLELATASAAKEMAQYAQWIERRQRVEDEAREAEVHLAALKADVDRLTKEQTDGQSKLEQFRSEFTSLQQQYERLLSGLMDKTMWRRFGIPEWMTDVEGLGGKIPKVLLVALEVVLARQDHFPYLSGCNRDDALAYCAWLGITQMGTTVLPIELAIIALRAEERRRNRVVPAATHEVFVRAKPSGAGRPSTNEQIVRRALDHIDVVLQER